MPHGIWLILGGILLIVVAALVTTGIIDTILYILAGVLIVVGVVYLLRGRGTVV